MITTTNFIINPNKENQIDNRKIKILKTLTYSNNIQLNQLSPNKKKNYPSLQNTKDSMIKNCLLRKKTDIKVENILTMNDITMQNHEELIKELGKPIQKNLVFKRRKASIEGYRDLRKVVSLMKNIYGFMKFLKLYKISDEETLLKLANFLKLRFYNKGEVVFNENDDPDGFYGIITGKVSVYNSTTQNELNQYSHHNVNKNYQSSNIKIILSEGECFGEKALIYDVKRSNTIYSEDSTYLFYIAKKYFNLLFKSIMLQAENDKKNFVLSHFSNGDFFEIEKIYSDMVMKFYNKGDVVIDSNQYADRIYLILQGECSLNMRIEKKMRRIFLSSKGDLLGLESLSNLYNEKHQNNKNTNNDYTYNTDNDYYYKYKIVSETYNCILISIGINNLKKVKSTKVINYLFEIKKRKEKINLYMRNQRNLSFLEMTKRHKEMNNRTSNKQTINPSKISSSNNNEVSLEFTKCNKTKELTYNFSMNMNILNKYNESTKKDDFKHSFSLYRNKSLILRDLPSRIMTNEKNNMVDENIGNIDSMRRVDSSNNMNNLLSSNRDEYMNNIKLDDRIQLKNNENMLIKRNFSNKNLSNNTYINTFTNTNTNSVIGLDTLSIFFNKETFETDEKRKKSVFEHGKMYIKEKNKSIHNSKISNFIKNTTTNSLFNYNYNSKISLNIDKSLIPNRRIRNLIKISNCLGSETCSYSIMNTNSNSKKMTYNSGKFNIPFISSNSNMNI